MSAPSPLFEGLFDGEATVTCPVAHELMCCDFNSTGELLAVGMTNGFITVFQVSTGTPLYKLFSAGLEHLPVTAVRFLKGGGTEQQGILMAAYASGHVRQWYVSTGQCLSTIQEDRQTLAAAFSPDGRSYATSGSDNVIYIYDQTTHQLINTLQPSMSITVMDGHVSRVFALVYHPSDPNTLISAGWDDTVQFWDTRKSRSTRKISGPHVCGDALDIQPDTLNLVTGSWRYPNALQVWDFDTGNLLHTLQKDRKTKYYAACWLNADTVLAGGTQEASALAVNVSNNKVMGRVSKLDHGVYSMKYCTSNGRIAIAAGTNTYITSLAARPRRASK